MNITNGKFKNLIMLKKIDQWIVEINRKENAFAIYRDNGDQMIESATGGKTTTSDDLVDLLKKKLSDRVKSMYGKNHHHVLRPSFEHGDGLFDIPVDIFQTGTSDSPENDQKDSPNKRQQAFTHQPPSFPGYYWYTSDPNNIAPKPVEVLARQEVEWSGETSYMTVVEMGFGSEVVIDEYMTEGAAWSKKQIPVPKVFIGNDEKEIDHADW